MSILKIKPTEDYKTQSPLEVIQEFESDLNLGLSDTIVKQDISDYGYNEILTSKPSVLLRFLKRFWGLSAWMLEITIIISWILQRYSDVIIILSLMILNAILGFIQDQKVSNAVEKLKQKLNINAKVLRSKIWIPIPARELVPGDIIRVRMGDFVPADLKIIEGGLSLDQSSITGESNPVSVNSPDLVYAGSIIKQGEALAIVVNTGKNTFFGKTTELVTIAHPKLHMEDLISKTVRYLFIFVVILILIILIIASIKSLNLLELLPLFLVLLLSAIPVALPVMFTMTMALGSMELLKKGVLVTRLSASEDAANMDVLCTDKTGTITTNKLSIEKIIPYLNVPNDEILLMGALASQEANQDPIDLAFIRAIKQKKLDLFSHKILEFRPFDPQRRRTEVDIDEGGKKITVFKGAVKTIISLCSESIELSNWAEPILSTLSVDGSRVLAIASQKEDSNILLLGLVALSDPLRIDSKELVDDLHSLGITVKIITGDNIAIAQHISKEIGLNGTITHGLDLNKMIKEDPQQALRIVDQSDGFAEIYPQDKLEIVKILQNAGHTVGMTGDGVNDAPALRQAEVGIAVQSATDVAKESASVVLTTSGIVDIIDLVKTGRVIYQRIKVWLLNKLVRTLLKNLLVVIAFLATGLFITNAFSMILILLLNDFMKITLATDNMTPNSQPDSWNISKLVRSAVILGLISLGESFLILYLGDIFFGVISNVPQLQTFTFELLLFSAVFQIFDIREKNHFWHSKPSRSLFISMVIDLICGILIGLFGLPGLVPISMDLMIFTIGMTFFFFLIVNDAIKFFLHNKKIIDW
jgi:H+-transporting ATPase